MKSVDHLAIVTGTSSGLGACIAKHLAEHGYRVFGSARRPAAEGLHGAIAEGLYHHANVDFAEPNRIESYFRSILDQNPQGPSQSVLLVNNVGTEQPLGRLEQFSASDIQANLNINLVSPFLLTSAFLRWVADWKIDKRIINISSGLAARNLTGTGAYSVAKAGLEMLTRQIAEEQKDARYPTLTVSARPGIIATEMQMRLRETPVSRFPPAETFKNFHDSGQLEDAPEVSLALVRDLVQAEIVTGACYRFGDGSFNLIQ